MAVNDDKGRGTVGFFSDGSVSHLWLCSDEKDSVTVPLGFVKVTVLFLLTSR